LLCDNLVGFRIYLPTLFVGVVLVSMSYTLARFY
jgi:hypothetical protein